MVYAHDPQSAPDSEYVPGELAHAVAGNRGRLLDQRRTPILIIEVEPAKAQFELEVCAFEDAGAHWVLALEEIARFQFERSAARAPAETLARLRSSVGRFSRTVTLEASSTARPGSLARIATERVAAGRWLTQRNAPRAIDLPGLISRREGDGELARLLGDYLDQRGLGDLERRFADTIVSNPGSGELVKAHAIVLAELGLCRYQGRILRDPEVLGEPDTRALRAEHLLVRLGFSQAMWSHLGHEQVTLYRGAAVEGSWHARAPASFVSATFSREVAEAHFEGGATAVIWRQEVPIERVLMTFVETAAMSRRFREAEAMLIGEADNPAF